MEAVQVRPSAGLRAGADFVDCYQAHYRRLVRALRLSGADPATAEDVAQEAFARALARWRRVSRGTNPPGYVYTTGFRLLQRAQRHPPEPSTDGPSEQPARRRRPTTAVAVEAALRGHAAPPAGLRGHVLRRRHVGAGGGRGARDRRRHRAQASGGGPPRPRRRAHLPANRP